MYWDGEKSPSVESPIGDFFGVGFAEYRQFISVPLGMTSGGYLCFFPMPFAESCRIEIENDGPMPIKSFYCMMGYYYFKELDENVARFHAKWRREKETKIGVPYTMLEANGRGHFVGCNLSMQGLEKERGFWFLEGNFEAYVDGEKTLSYGSTGTEDYFLSGWYFKLGTFHAPYHGLVIKDEEKLRIAAYRFHIADPIPFEKSIKAVIHHGEWDDVKTDYSSVAYWYQLEPHREFFKMPSANERIPTKV
jgi:hypothetical protein